MVTAKNSKAGQGGHCDGASEIDVVGKVSPREGLAQWLTLEQT